MKPVAIVGAGITGLTAAFRLAEDNIPVIVYEASGHVGGVIRTHREDGYLAESGPNAITETSRAITSLIEDTGLMRPRIYSNPGASANFLLHHGRLVRAPTSIPGFITTPLFSLGGKLRACCEPFIPPHHSQEDETLAAFVTRRLGREFLDNVIDPFVAGIYAGDPALLSVRQGFPKLSAAEQLHGSLVRAQIFGARARRRSGEIPKTAARKFSFDHGLGVLPNRLKERLGHAVRFHMPVKAIQDLGGEWTIHCPGQPPFFHSAVLLAAPAHKLGNIIFHAHGSSPGALAPLGDIVHPPVATVVLGFRRTDVTHPLTGFGFLVPASENRRILGTIFSSSIFSNRAPSGHVTLTTFIGGCRNQELALQPHGEIIATALADLQEMLGITGKPTFQHCTVVPHAIPQYNVGFARYKQAMEKLESAHPGLFFAGTCKDGIALGNSITSGHDVARRIRACLARIPEQAAHAA